MTELALSEKDEIIIQIQLGSGRYSNAAEVVTAALELMQEADGDFEHWLQKEIPVRLAALRNDPSLGIPLDEVTARLAARHRARIEKIS